MKPNPDKILEALRWYRDEATAVNQNLGDPNKSNALLASLTVFANDCGTRADGAIAQYLAQDEQVRAEAAAYRELQQIVLDLRPDLREKKISVLFRLGLESLPAPFHRCIELKSDPLPFKEVYAGRKTHEIRHNDRNYQVGQHLWVRETVASGEDMRLGQPLEYTGYSFRATITHIQKGYGLNKGWVVLSMGNIHNSYTPPVHT